MSTIAETITRLILRDNSERQVSTRSLLLFGTLRVHSALRVKRIVKSEKMAFNSRDWFDLSLSSVELVTDLSSTLELQFFVIQETKMRVELSRSPSGTESIGTRVPSMKLQGEDLTYDRATGRESCHPRHLLTDRVVRAWLLPLRRARPSHGS